MAKARRLASLISWHNRQLHTCSSRVHGPARSWAKTRRPLQNSTAWSTQTASGEERIFTVAGFLQ